VSQRFVPHIRVPKMCPSCDRQSTLMPFIASDSKPGLWRLSLMDEKAAKENTAILGGTSFMCRPHVCKYCGYVMFFYDEEITWNLPPASEPKEP
jgi:predicted Zn-ribbon and HTH transcriptional regulator